MPDDYVICAGGGIAGIVAAAVAQYYGHKPVIIEKSDSLGGLWKSRRLEVNNGVYYVDEGLRLIQSNNDNEDLYQYLFHEDIQGVDWIKKQGWRLEGGVYNGQFYKNTSCLDARVLSEKEYRRCLDDFIEASRQPHISGGFDNCREEIESRYGRAAADLLFEPVVGRIFGRKLSELGPGACSTVIPQRIVYGKYTDISGQLHNPEYLDYLGHESRTEIPAHIKRYFLYPATGGIQAWIAAIEDKIKRNGGLILCGESVAEIEANGDIISSVRLQSGVELECRALVWTLPAVMLNRMCGHAVKGTGAPEFLDLEIMHFVLDKSVNHEIEYLINHDSEGSFTRAVFYQNILDIAENILTVEHLHNPKSGHGNDAERIIHELIDLGCLDANSIVKNKIHNHYGQFVPVPTIEFTRQNIEQQKIAAGLFKNIITAGKSSGGDNFVHDIVKSMDKKISEIDGVGPRG